MPSVVIASGLSGVALAKPEAKRSLFSDKEAYTIVIRPVRLWECQKGKCII